MKMTLKSIAIILAMTLPSCNKTDNGGTFILKGTCVKDCSETPFANQKITVVLYKYGLNSKEKYTAGEGITDDNGNFIITCENHGYSTVFLEGISNFPITEIPGGKDQTFDMGKIYSKYYKVCNLKITFQTPHVDTFYLGTSTTPWEFIPNPNGTHYLRVTMPSYDGYKTYSSSNRSFSYGNTLTYKYGFSYNGYKNNLKNMPQLYITNAFKPCQNNDTVSLIIP